ncbi:MAG: ATP-dependent DNA helicase RecG [Chloroflexi bacterium]|nr:ATP-dependent DNA helicase RecG [Chloroflexota bacterium]
MTAAAGANPAREQIIRLGHALVAEQRRDYDDCAHAGGLAGFLAAWRADADAALGHEAVRVTLVALAEYAALPADGRRERLDAAIVRLRALVRSLPATLAAPPPRPARRARASQPAAAAPFTLATPLDAVESVGRQNALAFRRLGVHTVHDLLYHLPHRYDDFSSQLPIARLTPGAVATVVAEVRELRSFTMRAGGGGTEVLLADDSGVLKAVFFRQPWLARQLRPGMRLVVSGRVELAFGARQMTGPDWQQADAELLHAGRIVPVHPLTRGLVERSARSVIRQVVERAAPLVVDHLPEATRQRAGLVPLGEALCHVHFPPDQAALERARRRLGFDEFFLIQLGVLRRKAEWQQASGYAIADAPAVHRAFLQRLPFAPTRAQARTIEEIGADMARPVPMARLLQGDVGSGKTAVAAAAALRAIAGGFQVALMAPTEILAEQHYRGLKGLLSGVPVRQPPPDDGVASAERLAEIRALLGLAFEGDLGPAGVRVALLTGGLGARARRRVLAALAQGDIDLLIGTHALISESVAYRQLGLVIVDEQHRFGVEQRQRLKDKGFNPHLLVMTATPIPRTLTLTLHGDLDTSILDELPPGRQEIRTRWIRSADRERAYRHIRREIAAGRQVFVICPLVEESEKIDLPSAEEMHQRLSQAVFPELRVTLIHGKMAPRDKDAVMVAFRNHAFDILVATAVIEVGIDIPNASTIMIEGADRFGLAQLHQFRGRVGRGQHASFCILVSDRDNEVTTRRLQAMEQTRDGFRLAEIDLELRGPGEFFGTRQSGTPDLKVAQLADTRLLLTAQQEARRIIEADPTLAQPEHAALLARIEAFWSEGVQSG